MLLRIANLKILSGEGKIPGNLARILVFWAR